MCVFIELQACAISTAGGGIYTFGAPMVLKADSVEKLFADLVKLLKPYVQMQASFEFHNFVNNADVVPRLLGRSLRWLTRVVSALPILNKIKVWYSNMKDQSPYHCDL